MKFISDILRSIADQLEGKFIINPDSVEAVVKNSEVENLTDAIIELKDEGLSKILNNLFLNHHFKPEEIDYDTLNQYVNNHGEEFLDLFSNERILEYLSNLTLDRDKYLDNMDKEDIVDYIRENGYWCDNDKSDLVERVIDSEGEDSVLEEVSKPDIKEYMNNNGYVCAKDTTEILELISTRDDIEKPLSKAIDSLDDDAKGLLLATMDLDTFHTMSINQFVTNNITKIAEHIRRNL